MFVWRLPKGTPFQGLWSGLVWSGHLIIEMHNIVFQLLGSTSCLNIRDICHSWTLNFLQPNFKIPNGTVSWQSPNRIILACECSVGLWSLYVCMYYDMLRIKHSIVIYYVVLYVICYYVVMLYYTTI